MRLPYILFGAAAFATLAAMAYVRFTPVDASAGVGRPDAQPVGDYPSEGGFYVVRPTSDIKVSDLEAVITASPRTKKLATGVFETRSAVWAFPDITHFWEEDGRVHLSSHLVYGRSDLGMNKKRIEGWLADLRR